MKKKVILLILLSMITLSVFGYLTRAKYIDALETFDNDGYILNGDETKENSSNSLLKFNAGTRYQTSSYEDKIIFNDSSNNKVSVGTDNFIHYSNESLQSLSNSVVLDTDELKDISISYYALTNKSLLAKAGDSYTTSNAGMTIDFSNFVWKLSSERYMVVSKTITFVASETAQQTFENYIEVQYNDEGVVSLVNKDGIYSTISSDAYLELDNGIRIYLGTKNVSDGENILVNMTQMVVNSDDNIEIIPDEEYNNENVKQPQIIVNATDGEDGENGENAEAAQNGANGQNGTSLGDGLGGQNGLTYYQVSRAQELNNEGVEVLNYEDWSKKVQEGELPEGEYNKYVQAIIDQAIEDGIIDDYETWLEQFNGTNGIDGTNGTDGQNGNAGTNGNPGNDGIDGKPGAIGETGETGDEGTAGGNGTNGNDGIEGNQGENGTNGENGADGDKGLSAYRQEVLDYLEKDDATAIESYFEWIKNEDNIEREKEDKQAYENYVAEIINQEGITDLKKYEEWLELLDGEDGNPGAQGGNGNPGAPGQNADYSDYTYQEYGLPGFYFVDISNEEGVEKFLDVTAYSVNASIGLTQESICTGSASDKKACVYLNNNYESVDFIIMEQSTNSIVYQNRINPNALSKIDSSNESTYEGNWLTSNKEQPFAGLKQNTTYLIMVNSSFTNDLNEPYRYQTVLTKQFTTTAFGLDLKHEASSVDSAVLKVDYDEAALKGINAFQIQIYKDTYGIKEALKYNEEKTTVIGDDGTWLQPNDLKPGDEAYGKIFSLSNLNKGITENGYQSDYGFNIDYAGLESNTQYYAKIYVTSTKATNSIPDGTYDYVAFKTLKKTPAIKEAKLSYVIKDNNVLVQPGIVTDVDSAVTGFRFDFYEVGGDGVTPAYSINKNNLDNFNVPVVSDGSDKGLERGKRYYCVSTALYNNNAYDSEVHSEPSSMLYLDIVNQFPEVDVIFGHYTGGENDNKTAASIIDGTLYIKDVGNIIDESSYITVSLRTVNQNTSNGPVYGDQYNIAIPKGTIINGVKNYDLEFAFAGLYADTDYIVEFKAGKIQYQEVGSSISTVATNFPLWSETISTGSYTPLYLDSETSSDMSGSNFALNLFFTMGDPDREYLETNRISYNEEKLYGYEFLDSTKAMFGGEISNTYDLSLRALDSISFDVYVGDPTGVVKGPIVSQGSEINKESFTMPQDEPYSVTKDTDDYVGTYDFKNDSRFFVVKDKTIQVTDGVTEYASESQGGVKKYYSGLFPASYVADAQGNPESKGIFPIKYSNQFEKGAESYAFKISNETFANDEYFLTLLNKYIGECNGKTPTVYIKLNAALDYTGKNQIRIGISDSYIENDQDVNGSIFDRFVQVTAKKSLPTFKDKNIVANGFNYNDLTHDNTSTNPNLVKDLSKLPSNIMDNNGNNSAGITNLENTIWLNDKILDKHSTDAYIGFIIRDTESVNGNLMPSYLGEYASEVKYYVFKGTKENVSVLSAPNYENNKILTDAYLPKNAGSYISLSGSFEYEKFDTNTDGYGDLVNTINSAGRYRVSQISEDQRYYVSRFDAGVPVYSQNINDAILVDFVQNENLIHVSDWLSVSNSSLPYYACYFDVQDPTTGKKLERGNTYTVVAEIKLKEFDNTIWPTQYQPMTNIVSTTISVNKIAQDLSFIEYQSKFNKQGDYYNDLFYVRIEDIDEAIEYSVIDNKKYINLHEKDSSTIIPSKLEKVNEIIDENGNPIDNIYSILLPSERDEFTYRYKLLSNAEAKNEKLPKVITTYDYDFSELRFSNNISTANSYVENNSDYKKNGILEASVNNVKGMIVVPNSNNSYFDIYLQLESPSKIADSGLKQIDFKFVNDEKSKPAYDAYCINYTGAGSPLEYKEWIKTITTGSGYLQTVSVKSNKITELTNDDSQVRVIKVSIPYSDLRIYSDSLTEYTVTPTLYIETGKYGLLYAKQETDLTKLDKANLIKSAKEVDNFQGAEWAEYKGFKYSNISNVMYTTQGEAGLNFRNLTQVSYNAINTVNVKNFPNEAYVSIPYDNDGLKYVPKEVYVITGEVSNKVQQSHTVPDVSNIITDAGMKFISMSLTMPTGKGSLDSEKGMTLWYKVDGAWKQVTAINDNSVTKIPFDSSNKYTTGVITKLTYKEDNNSVDVTIEPNTEYPLSLRGYLKDGPTSYREVSLISESKIITLNEIDIKVKNATLNVVGKNGEINRDSKRVTVNVEMLRTHIQDIQVGVNKFYISVYNENDLINPIDVIAIKPEDVIELIEQNNPDAKATDQVNYSSTFDFDWEPDTSHVFNGSTSYVFVPSVDYKLGTHAYEIVSYKTRYNGADQSGNAYYLENRPKWDNTHTESDIVAFDMASSIKTIPASGDTPETKVGYVQFDLSLADQYRILTGNKDSSGNESVRLLMELYKGPEPGEQIDFDLSQDPEDYGEGKVSLSDLTSGMKKVRDVEGKIHDVIVVDVPIEEKFSQMLTIKQMNVEQDTDYTLHIYTILDGENANGYIKDDLFNISCIVNGKEKYINATNDGVSLNSENKYLSSEWRISGNKIMLDGSNKMLSVNSENSLCLSDEGVSWKFERKTDTGYADVNKLKDSGYCDGLYRISYSVGVNTYYLKNNNGSLSLTSDPSEATEMYVSSAVLPYVDVEKEMYEYDSTLKTLKDFNSKEYLLIDKTDKSIKMSLNSLTNESWSHTWTLEVANESNEFTTTNNLDYGKKYRVSCLIGEVKYYLMTNPDNSISLTQNKEQAGLYSSTTDELYNPRLILNNNIYSFDKYKILNYDQGTQQTIAYESGVSKVKSLITARIKSKSNNDIEYIGAELDVNKGNVKIYGRHLNKVNKIVYAIWPANPSQQPSNNYTILSSETGFGTKYGQHVNGYYYLSIGKELLSQYGPGAYVKVTLYENEDDVAAAARFFAYAE